jgi:hypothetical protein
VSDLNEVSYKLGQIDGKLDLVLEALKAHVDDDAKKHADSDTRVSRLERSKSWLMGASVAVGVVVSSVWNMVIR